MTDLETEPTGTPNRQRMMQEKRDLVDALKPKNESHSEVCEDTITRIERVITDPTDDYPPDPARTPEPVEEMASHVQGTPNIDRTTRRR